MGQPIPDSHRDGYDFDARYEDGLASFYDKELYELLEANAPVMSKELKQTGGYGKNGKKGFDTMITRLQKQCYVITSHIFMLHQIILHWCFRILHIHPGFLENHTETTEKTTQKIMAE